MNILTVCENSVETMQFLAPAISIPSQKPYTLLPMHFSVSQNISIKYIDDIINETLKPYSEDILFSHFPELGYWELYISNTKYLVNIYKNNKENNHILEFQKYDTINTEISTLQTINTIFHELQKKMTTTTISHSLIHPQTA
jgi:hypothetical protein